MLKINPSKYSLAKCGAVGLVSLVLFIIAYTLFFLLTAETVDYKNVSEEASEPTRANNEVLTIESEILFQEQIAPIIKKGDMSACEQVKNNIYKNVCINNIALNKAQETKDISYCQHLDNDLVERSSCEIQILIKKSIEEENLAVCDTTKDEGVRRECQDSFFLGVAVANSDPEFCNEASDVVKANQCWNEYYAKSFFISTSSQGLSEEVDCSLFRGDDARADCSAITAAMKENSQTELIEACQEHQSEAFDFNCMIWRQNFGRAVIERVP